MKTWLTILMIPLAIGVLSGCDNNDDIVASDDKVPATPQGVFSVTGNGEVTVYWNGIYEHDVKKYNVYRSLEPINNYGFLGSVAAEPNPDLNLLIYEYVDDSPANGTTYWYAVTAVDNAGQESLLSAEDVYDTPRPDGQDAVYPNDVDSSLAGFNLMTGYVVGWKSQAADFFADRIVVSGQSGTIVYPFINAANDSTDIQDLGYTGSFDDVTWAPTDGWSALGYAEAIVGHTYVIWTRDDHYAKVRITSISPSGALSFQWAYQTSTSELGQLELAPPNRPEHGSDYPAQDKSAGLLR